MSIFLTQEQKELLQMMSILPPSAYVRDGKKIPGKLWPLGINTCTLIRSRLKKTRIGTYMLAVELVRENINVVDFKTKVSFVPHVDFLTEETVKLFLSAFGYDLKHKPPNMANKTYLGHVRRRVDTFIGKELKVVVSYGKEQRRDEYGHAVKYHRFHDDIRDVFDYRMNVSYNIGSHLDWWGISRIFVNKGEKL